ncbi:MAG TPA: polyphosphate kinase 1 [Gemmatimonadaceae bacterium]|nr:polyphosphate kinase 1 [Gemmatimonadaceae bacterium]
MTTAPVLQAAGVGVGTGAQLLNRELSWLEFNARVLHEALDERNRLLERLKFVAIFSANLDEFYMVRVAGLRREVARGDRARRADGRRPAEQLVLVRERAAELLREQRECLHGVLLPKLAEHGIRISPTAELSPEQWARVDEFFEGQVRSQLVPLPLGAGYTIPAASSRLFALAVELHDPGTGLDCIRLVKVPGTVSRWVPTGDPLVFVPLEQVIGANLRTVFPAQEVRGWYAFRVTRWADLTVGGEATALDLLNTVEEQVFGRRFAEVARVELEDSMPAHVRESLLDSLREEEELEDEPASVTADDVQTAGPLLQLSDLFSIAGLNIAALRDPPFTPHVPRELEGRRESIFDLIRARDIMVHHPFESFSASVERFLETAAADEQVREIRLTVYRTSGSSAIVRAITEAAQRGKEVTALVELQARFDEAANITWARALERAGARVSHTVPGLKTHAKLAMVAREEEGGLRNYVHIGTGNYNVRTARVYTDFGLFTSRPEVGADVRDLFDIAVGDRHQGVPRTLLVSPVNLRERLQQLIGREAAAARAGRRAHIIAKMNALVDPTVVRSLYDASQSGVEIDLLVRGTCTLRPGVSGLSDRIRVLSIVGRFLEHSRAWYFHNSGDPEYFVGSADWMERNLDRRVEVVAPILDQVLKDRLHSLLHTYLADNRQAWELQADGTYTQRIPGAEPELAVHGLLLEKPWGQG